MKSDVIRVTIQHIFVTSAMRATCGNMAAPEERARKMAMPPDQPILPRRKRLPTSEFASVVVHWRRRQARIWARRGDPAAGQVGKSESGKKARFRLFPNSIVTSFHSL